MPPAKYSHEQLVQLAKLSPEELAEIQQRRRLHNRLGFAYQYAISLRACNIICRIKDHEYLPVSLSTYVPDSWPLARQLV